MSWSALDLPLSGRKIAIVGGCGHVGLPLGVKLSLAGATTVLIDTALEAVESVRSGRFPFRENGGDEKLRLALGRRLSATTERRACKGADVFVFVTGTPIDEHLNAKLTPLFSVFDEYRRYFSSRSLVVMRSTLFPGTMEHLRSRALQGGIDVRLAFCPERVTQGHALDEIESLPQIVAGFDDESFQAAYEIFSAIAPSVIRLSPLEAELAKLMTNSWRYVEFAIANQFYMIAEASGVDFHRVHQAIRHEYPRAAGYKSPGFTAGPCLFKDTMQLASFFKHRYYLGHAAMLVNEGLADLAVEKAAKLLGEDLWGKTLGLLGMAFKPNSDDVRDSLSFRVKKGLEFRGAKVIWHDPFLPDSLSLAEVLERSDALILCVPHDQYVDLPTGRPVVDVWGIHRRSEVEILPGKRRRAREGARTGRSRLSRKAS